MSDVIIVGIGNPFRSDDAAGWAVIDGLHGKVNSDVKLCKEKGDIFELMDIFANNKHVYLVDACYINANPGTWYRIDANRQQVCMQSQTSTHGLSISQAIALAKNLNQLPERLVIYAISGNNFCIGEGISSQMKQAIENVILAILKEDDIKAYIK